jgi:hypothetical protein
MVCTALKGCVIGTTRSRVGSGRHPGSAFRRAGHRSCRWPHLRFVLQPVYSDLIRVIRLRGALGL